MKKIFLILAIFFLYASANNSFVNIKRLNKASLEVILKQLAKELSKQIPKKIDEFSTLKKVYSEKNRFFIEKEFNTKKADEIKNALKTEKSKLFIKQLFLNSDKKEICNENTFKYILVRGSTIEVKWFNEKNRLIFNYQIDNRHCLSSY